MAEGMKPGDGKRAPAGGSSAAAATVQPLAAATTFLESTPEKEGFNQYWYSKPTIAAIVAEVTASGGRCAFLSTPSVFYSVPDRAEAGHKLFDFDEQWNSDPAFVSFDYRAPTHIPEADRGAFDMVVIDPPFITEDVWRLYAQAAALLLKPHGRVLASTVYENEGLMKELFGAAPQRFLPSIPHLVYQYRFYANYTCTALTERNSEVPDE